MNNKQVNTSKIATLKIMLERAKPSFSAVLPKHITPERIIKIALAATSRTPLLLECDSTSIIKAVMSASQLGLEPDGTLGGCYIIPYKNGKTGRYEAQFQIGYRGLIDLARRGGQITTIEAHIVKKSDVFKCVFGLNPILEHEPSLSGVANDDITCVYAVARFKDGGYQYEVMTKNDIDAIRKRSKTSSSGPWVTDYEEMARKTVIKRLCKYLPLSVELKDALKLDNASEAGESQNDFIDLDISDEVIDGETGEIIPVEDSSKSSKIADQF